MNNNVVIKISSWPDYSKLYKYMFNKKLIDSGLILDLSSHTFFKPIHVIVLTLFIINHIKIGTPLSLKFPTNPRFEEYFNKIGFLEFISKNYKESVTINNIKSKTAMPIRRIDTTNMDAYIYKAVEYFKIICPGKDLSMLNLGVSELINNVYDHAKSPIDAYVFCQYYSRVKEIKLIVGDLGIGIPESVNKYLVGEKKGEKSAFDAIKWAVMENTSTLTQPHNRGKGLNHLYEFMKINKGTLLILSGYSGMYSNFQKDICVKNNITDFVGTVIQLVIKTENLNDDDENDVDLW